MLAEFFSPDQLAILTQIILIDLVLAGDNAIIIGMVLLFTDYRVILNAEFSILMLVIYQK